MACPADIVRQTAERAARQSYGRLVALLAKRTRNVAAAEDAFGDAMAAALTVWPNEGVPQSPDAWLMSAAKRKLLDAGRRTATAQAASRDVRLITEHLGALAAAKKKGVPDERLALMFACAHPAIEEGARAPLILQTVLGFNAAEVAAAFLVTPTAMGQRLVRQDQDPGRRDSFSVARARRTG